MIVLSHFQTEKLLAARERGEPATQISLDLGLSEERVELSSAGVTLRGENALFWDDIERITAEDTKCFAVEADSIRPISIFSETTNWVRSLMPTEAAPTTLVGGFPMHRIKDTDPMRDTRQKVQAVRPVIGRVLDTATGLGYTAIEAARTADHVVSVELDPAAIEIARQNPWSQELFECDDIELIVGDVYEEVEGFEDASFDRIIHDPPTMSLAGELYSADFYRELHRLLARRGRLFHYIGDPEGRTGRTITDGVVRRLEEVGFERVRRRPDAFGVVAYR